MCLKTRVSEKAGAKIYLQGNELLQDLNTLMVFWVFVNVGVSKEGLKRTDCFKES